MFARYRNSAAATAALLLVCALPLLAAAPALSAYTTPGTGVDWTFDDLVVHSGGAVAGSGGNYTVHEALIVALNDRLTIPAGTVVTFVDLVGEVGLEVNGALVATGTEAEPVLLQGSVSVPGSWRGLNFRDTGAGSEFHLVHCRIIHANEAVAVFGADITLEHCEISHTASRALALSAAGGLITGCSFHHNEQRTVTMTLSASPTLEDCHFEHNNLQNTSPYPYLNIGLQGVNSPTIRGNTILGSGNHMSGGIAIWNASNAVIEDNVISGCGYGILCFQTGANPTIRDNVISDNTIHPDTVNWGFGVACNGSNAPILTGNRITGHWYGVAAINGGQPNLGDLVNDFPGDDGGNILVDNGLGGVVYGFYNNTPLPQMAQGNWWGGADAQTVEDAIYHQVDDPGLGLVDYDFWLTSVGADDVLPPAAGVLTAVSAHPNPFNPLVTVSFTLNQSSHVSVVVVDLKGRMLRELHGGRLAAGSRSVVWDGTDQAGRSLPSGVYFYRVVAGAEARAGKLVLAR
jgi:parallel beta-helix repeat protein